MKLAAIVHGIVTIPKRVRRVGALVAVSCGLAVAAMGSVWTPEAVRSAAVTPAQPATPAVPEVTGGTQEVLASAEATMPGEPRRFLPEARDESVVLDVSSQGCFDGAEPERFEIRGDNPGVVRVLAAEGRAVLREIALDAETRKELERTIAFYRAPPEGVICSTIDMVRIAFRQGEQELWSETFEDSSCETDYQGAPWSLAALFDAERHAERLAGRDERTPRRPVE